MNRKQFLTTNTVERKITGNWIWSCDKVRVNIYPRRTYVDIHRAFHIPNKIIVDAFQFKIIQYREVLFIYFWYKSDILSSALVCFVNFWKFQLRNVRYFTLSNKHSVNLSIRPASLEHNRITKFLTKSIDFHVNNVESRLSNL